MAGIKAGLIVTYCAEEGCLCSFSFFVFVFLLLFLLFTAVRISIVKKGLADYLH